MKFIKLKKPFRFKNGTQKLSRLPKPGKTTVLVGCLFVLMVMGLLCGVIFAREGAPDNPLGKTADIAEEQLLLDCESEIDEDVYIPAPVAAEQNTEGQIPEQTDTPLNEKEQEQEPPEEPESPVQQEQKQTPKANPQKQNESSSNHGGTGGGESGGVAEEEYFTTSVKNGETVTDADYYFEIHHKNEKLKVKETKITLNGTQIPQFGDSGSVALKEGNNTLRVTVDYTDSSGKIYSQFKDYTVILDTESLVIQTDLTDKTVTDELLKFSATASYLGKPAAVTVKLNGKEVTGKDGAFKVTLNEGANQILLEAKAGSLKTKKTFTITYENDGAFEIITDLVDGSTVNTENLPFSVRLRNSVSGSKITVKVNGTNVKGSNGDYSATLNFGENVIRISAVNGDSSKTRTSVEYHIRFERAEASREQPNPDPAHAPEITSINIADGEEFNNSVLQLAIYAKDYQGNPLYSGNMSVFLNGNEIYRTGTGNGYELYRLSFVAGQNTVTVKLKDEAGYSRFYEYRVKYTAGSGPIGHATVSVEATTLGLGYLIPPTQVEIFDGEPGSYVLARLLEANGFTYENGGSLDAAFYLKRIAKPGITSGYRIPGALQDYLDADYMVSNGIIYNDSLGEKDFYDASGWMYILSSNGIEEYPNYSFSELYLKDGDVIKIRFTLVYGVDIGGGMSNQNYPEIFIEP